MWGLEAILQKLHSVSCPQGFKIECPSWPRSLDPKTIVFILSKATCVCSSWKRLSKNCSLYSAFKVSQAKCPSWPWLLTQINGVPLYHHKQLVCEVWKRLSKNCSLQCLQGFKECKGCLWPLTPLPLKINRVPPLIITYMRSLEVIGGKL